MTIFIILPCYNEEKSLQPLLSKVVTMKERTGHPIHIVAVNDGSKDFTEAVLRQWSVQVPMTIINHKINRGLGETSRDGFETAAELANPDDVIVRMDADNTHEPDYIPSMVEKIERGYDVVIASRFQKGGGMEGVNAYRTFISLCANLFMKCMFPIKGVREYSCGFRAYRAEIIQVAIRIYGNEFVALKGLGFTCTLEKLVKLRHLGCRMTEVPFILKYNQKSGGSKMLTSVTTLGYLTLALLNIYPWGAMTKKWRNEARQYRKTMKARPELAAQES
ncbi:MAG: glycosyltransferase family 2 protein [Deltaproteobacteria bacterium]|nr:glycosyltransferase family 2 protein [Deltaproteobacteria bacterium]